MEKKKHISLVLEIPNKTKKGLPFQANEILLIGNPRLNVKKSPTEKQLLVPHKIQEKQQHTTCPGLNSLRSREFSSKLHGSSRSHLGRNFFLLESSNLTMT